MISVIKLFVFFLIFILLCEGVGISIVNKINIKLNIIALPIGMVFFGCLYELLVLPVQYFCLDSSLLKYALLITTIITIVIGRKGLINIRKKISKRDLVLILLFCVLFIFKSLDLYYSTKNYNGDNSFYISLINGISMDGILVNGIDANSYIKSLISPKYAFYGHMHFLGALSNLLNVDALITINFFQEWYRIVFYITNLYNICFVCFEYGIIKHVNKYVCAAIICLPYLGFTLDNEIIAVHTTTMLFLSALLIFYLKDNNKGWLLLFSLYAFHAISIRSTYIFLLAFFLLPYYLYLLINNRFEPKENVYIITPVLLFLILYFSFRKSYMILFCGLLLLLCIIYFIPKLVHKIGTKNTKYLYCIILGGIILFFIYNSISIGNIRATYDDVKIFDLLRLLFLDFSSYTNATRSIYHISYLLFSVMLLVNSYVEKRQITYCVLHAIVIYLLCINPLVAPYIAKFLIEVYERLFQQWVNPLLYLLIIDEFMDLFINTKYKKMVNIIMPSLLIICFSIYCIIQYVRYTKNNIDLFNDRKKEISYYYRVPLELCEFGKVIEKYAYDNNYKYVQITCPPGDVMKLSFVSKKIKYSTIMGNRTVVNNFLNHDYYTDQWNEDKYEHPVFFYLLEPYRFFDDWHLENDYDNVPNLEKELKESNTDIYILKKWNNRQETSYHLKEYLELFSELVFENDDYMAYAIKY